MIDLAPGSPILVRSAGELAAVAARAARADCLAVDVESNGLFVYRPGLCILQLAFSEDERLVVAVIDALLAPPSPLAAVLGPGGPIKVLHDLTFDARMLAEAGAPLARVRDTSVTAKMLGAPATGLASLLSVELGVTLHKRFQQHDWSLRPLTAEQIEYLAGDVRYLLALDEHLERRADALDLGPEIEAECAYKLEVADRPPRDTRPGYARIKGAGALDAAGLAVLRRLCQAREVAAESANVPPFKVIPSEVLLEIARRRPTSHAALRAVQGAVAGRAGRVADAWLDAVAAGLRDGEVPPEDRSLFVLERPDREAIARRRALSERIGAWRRREATQRGVDEQAVLPGHCAQDLIEVLLRATPGTQAAREAIAAIPGFGERRRERYLDALLALAEVPAGHAPGSSG